jgi:hypothetical protein
MPRLGGLGCHDARKSKLAELHFRIKYVRPAGRTNNQFHSGLRGTKLQGFLSVGMLAKEAAVFISIYDG